ncbi:MAG: hypothetical protein HOF15_10765, partial [Planctomycetaceae bacterium]|nr:hypothetical protein [Planctomycetaceae bacterium]
MSESSQLPENKRPVARPILVRKQNQTEPQADAKAAPSPIAQRSSSGPSATPIRVTARPAKLVQPHAEEDELDAELSEVAIRNAPPWLVSLLVHLVVLIALGLLMLPNLLDTPLMLEVVYAEKIGDQLDDAVLQSPVDQVPDI